jgi:hypothetical protein
MPNVTPNGLESRGYSTPSFAPTLISVVCLAHQGFKIYDIALAVLGQPWDFPRLRLLFPGLCPKVYKLSPHSFVSRQSLLAPTKYLPNRGLLSLPYNDKAWHTLDGIGSARLGTAWLGSGERPPTASKPVGTRDPAYQSSSFMLIMILPLPGHLIVADISSQTLSLRKIS